jgi:hypothetical protein
VAMAITLYVNAIWAGRILSCSFWEQLVDVSPYAFASGAMAAGMAGVARTLFGSDIGLLIRQMLVGACVYIGICWIFRLSAFSQLKSAAQLELARFREWHTA